MDLKIMLCVMASFLLLTSRVSCNVDESLLEASASYPVLPPAPPSPAKASPSPPPPASAVNSTPPAAPVKAFPPPPPVLTRPKNTKECFPLCWVRCTLHSRKNVCLRACVTCCDRCKCVPPGYYGNKEKCGKCYMNMTTRGGRPKCP